MATIQTRYLNEKEKQTGRRRLRHSEFWSGVSFSFLGDTFVYLLAVANNAGNLELGYISSALYLAGILLPIAPRLFKGKRMVSILTFSSIMRALVSLLYVSMLFTSGTPAVILLLITYSLYCIMRMFGVVFFDSTVKTVTSVKNRGRLLGSMSVTYQGGSIIARIISAVFTSIARFSGILGMVLLQIVGIFTTGVSAYHLSRIPGRAVASHTKGRTLMVIFREAVANRQIGLRLFVRWIFISVSVVNGLVIPFLRRSVGLDANIVLLYSVVAGIAAMLAGFVTKKFGDRLGSRPLILWTSILLVASYCLWFLLSAATPWWVFFLSGFLVNFFLSVTNVLAQRLVAGVTPDEEAVGFNSMSNFIIALCALATGLVSGFLVRDTVSAAGFLRIGGMAFGNSYSFTFLLAALLSLCGSIVTARLHESGSSSPREAAQVLFSLHGLQAVASLDRLARTNDPFERKALLVSLGTNLTGVATKAIRAELSLPFSQNAQEMLQALSIKPRAALIDDIIGIALDSDSSLQLDAIAALGAYRRHDKARETLELLMDSGKWSSARSMACKALAHWSAGKGTDYLPRIHEMSKSARHIDEEIDFLVAKHILDKDGDFLKEFFESVIQGRSATFRRIRYSVLATFLPSTGSQLSEMFQKWKNRDTDDYLSDFLDESRDVADLDREYSTILKAFRTLDYEWLHQFCFSLAEEAQVGEQGRLARLREGILVGKTLDKDLLDVHDYLALLYFVYLLRKNSKT